MSVDSPVAEALRDRYVLEREIGHGGMATVYLARDLKHQRMVAIKVLRPDLAASLGSERFLHEIEIAARLQHPHILPLLDSGQADGFLYYVMPYVEGESLRERLARIGELPISDAVRILAEVAEALAHAHSRGVVHRDMKPENIMVSGRHPLVMDFGIAKAVSPAVTNHNVTTQGVALGTPTYMAPEQAAAEPHLDHRVDIYALGVIGYELLVGSPPFVGGSAQEIFAAHLTQKPKPVSSQRPTVPPVLAAVIMKCLEKRPADRPQNADAVLQALESVFTPSDGNTATGSRLSPALASVVPRWAVLAGAVILLAMAGLLWQGRATGTRAPLARHTQLTFLGNIEQQEVSPDGQFLAHVERGEADRLVVKDLAGGSTIPLMRVGSDVVTVRWSSDGSSILYTGQDSSGRYVRVLFPRLGGIPRPLQGSAPERPLGMYAALSPDGAQVALWDQANRFPLALVTLATGSLRNIRIPDSLGWHDAGDWSPAGRLVAMLSRDTAGGRRWMLSRVDLETGLWHKILSDTLPLSSPRWSPAGDAVYYLRGSDLYKVPVSPNSLKVGAPQILQTDLAGSGFSITGDGKKLAYTKTQRHSNLWLATQPRRGALFEKAQITRGTTIKSGARFSPDGRLVAFVQQEGDRGDVFVLTAGGGTPRQITTSGTAARGPPAWSPDGEMLAFIGNVHGSMKLRTVSVADGREQTYDAAAGQADLAWAPHHRILYLRPGNRNYHWFDRLTGTEEPLVQNDTVGWMCCLVPSPDRRDVVVFWNRRWDGKPQRGVYLISLQDGAQRYLGAPETSPLGWSGDGTFLVEHGLGDIVRLEVRGREEVVLGRNPFKGASCELNEKATTMSLMCNVEESVSDAWMMENFDP